MRHLVAREEDLASLESMPGVQKWAKIGQKILIKSNVLSLSQMKWRGQVHPQEVSKGVIFQFNLKGGGIGNPCVFGHRQSAKEEERFHN